MWVVWKFHLDVTDEQRVSMPRGAAIRHIGMQGESLCLWAEVDPSADVEPRTIRIYDTGQEITHFRGSYLGTFLMRGGALVFHAYEVTQAELD